MTLRRFSLRLCALALAYALVLHGLLGALMAQPSTAPAALSTCLGADGSGAPSDQTPTPHDHGQACALHCLASQAADAWVPPVVGVVATFRPSKFDSLVLTPTGIAGRPALNRPQSPRAPPVA